LVIGKPTHRFVRENSNDDDSYSGKGIKEILAKIPGYGSSSPPKPSPAPTPTPTPKPTPTPTYQPDSSTYQPDSSTYQPDSSISYQQETAAGPEPAETEVQPSIAAKEGIFSSTGFPSYTKYM